MFFVTQHRKKSYHYHFGHMVRENTGSYHEAFDFFSGTRDGRPSGISIYRRESILHRCGNESTRPRVQQQPSGAGASSWDAFPSQQQPTVQIEQVNAKAGQVEWVDDKTGQVNEKVGQIDTITM